MWLARGELHFLVVFTRCFVTSENPNIDLRFRVMYKSNTNSEAMYSRRKDESRNFFGRHRARLRKVAGNQLREEHVCYTHLKGLAGQIGVQVESLNVDDLREILLNCHLHRSGLDAYKHSNPNQRKNVVPWLLGDLAVDL